MPAPDPNDSLFLVPSLTAAAMLIFGISALAVNPKRATNQVLALLGFASLIHFLAMLMGRYEGAMWWTDPQHHNPLPWVRLKWAALGVIPLISWLLYYVVAGDYRSSRDLFFKMLPWWLVSIALVAMPYSIQFIPADSMPDHQSRGPAFTLYHIVMISVAAVLCFVSMLRVRKLKGVKRLEFQQLTVAMSYYTLAAFLLPKYFYFNSFLIFGLMAWSISTRRIYHTSRALRALAQKVVVIGAIATLATLAIMAMRKYGDSPYAVAAVIAVAFVVWQTCDKKIQSWLNLSTEQYIAQNSTNLKRIALNLRDPDKLVEELQKKLGEFGKTKRVVILRHEGEQYRSGDLIIPGALLPTTQGADEGWFSVSVQSRLVTDENTKRLVALLEKEHFPILVWPRWTVNSPSIIIAFGERENELPFTYPEINVLREFAEVVETLHTQANFALQAQQAEQLATIGMIAASAAHEIRQPLSALTTFSELVPNIIKNEGELREWAKVLPGEGKRISSFVEQLLDLAKPRHYSFAPVLLQDVITDTIKLTNAKATEREVTVFNDLHTPMTKIMGDDQALKQVFLNLLENGIQALGNTAGPREIRIQSKETERHIEIEVVDNGPGIPQEIRSTLFRPFVTKGKKGGCGLGLAMCLTIMKAHKGSIVADKRGTGNGTTFRLAFPISTYNLAQAV